MNTENKKPVVDDFDPFQGWEGHADAIDYCNRQADPQEAARRIVDANIQSDEAGWAAELLMNWDLIGATEDLPPVLTVATNMVGNMHLAWKGDNDRRTVFHGIRFVFKDLGDVITYFYRYINTEGATIVSGFKDEISNTQSCTRIAEFIREQILEVYARERKHVADPSDKKKATVSYSAVPVLVYVPSGVADPESAVMDVLSRGDCIPLIASDFATTVVSVTEDARLNTCISDVCPSL